MLRGECLRAAKSALAKGLLFYRVTDQYGRSCNGGDRTFRLDQAADGRPGKWAPEIDNPSLCSRGYHATMDPIRWLGLRVELVEVRQVCCRVEDKIVTTSMRSLGVVDPEECIDPRIWVAVNRPILYSADLRSANLRGADLDGADLRSANLRGADLDGADLDGADLRGANLDSADLDGADLSGADLDGADLRSANLRGADLGSANLRGANLDSANLRGANLDSANLRDADLGSANLSGANLRSANLSGADLSSADLRSANLSGADLSSADLRSATACNHTSWPSGFDPKAAGVIVVED
jgi:hypothetical protein